MMCVQGVGAEIESSGVGMRGDEASTIWSALASVRDNALDNLSGSIQGAVDPDTSGFCRRTPDTYRPASRSASLIIARKPSGFHDSPVASLPLTKKVGVPCTPRARPRMPS